MGTMDLRTTSTCSELNVTLKFRGKDPNFSLTFPIYRAGLVCFSTGLLFFIPTAMSPSSERPQSPAPSERTHLLSDSDATSLKSSRTSVSDDLENFKAQRVITPIPKKQLGGKLSHHRALEKGGILTQSPVLFSIRFTEPIIYSHLWPYINQFVNDIGIADDPKNVGFYSGMIVSTPLYLSPQPTFTLHTGKCFCVRRSVFYFCSFKAVRRVLFPLCIA